MSDEQREWEPIQQLTDEVLDADHPATYSKSVLEQINLELTRHVPFGEMILDPFAGIGKIHDLRPAWQTWGIELEPEWALARSNTVCGSVMDAGEMFGKSPIFGAIVTSPCYGNRMADHHEAKDDSKRHTYRHTLGRMPTEGSSAVLHWGEEYREFHRQAWAAVMPLLLPGGVFVLNISDHIRKGQRQPVEAWHLSTLMQMGLQLESATRVGTRRQGHGANRHLRVDGEIVAVLRRV